MNRIGCNDVELFIGCEDVVPRVVVHDLNPGSFNTLLFSLLKYCDTTCGMSGSISQITIRSIPGYKTNVPAVTPGTEPYDKHGFRIWMRERGNVSQHPLQLHVLGCT